MKRRRILLLVNESLIPPDDLRGLSEDQIEACRTEYNVLSTLVNEGHDLRVLGIGDKIGELRRVIRDWRPEITFNLLEEFSGIVTYDHYVVAFLELMRQPYTGCNPRGMMLSRDKVLTKQILAYHRIPTPRFHPFPWGRVYRETRTLAYPLFVKSATEDASLGISQASVVHDAAHLRERVEFIHAQTQSDALAEQYIEGRELYVGVVGNERLTTFPVWELDFGKLPDVQAGIATRKVKWDPQYQRRHGIRTGPANDLPPGMDARIAALAKRVYRALHMSGYARMDFRMRPDGSVFVLEANANPNLTYGEDFAESGHIAGLNYEQLLSRIVQLGLNYRPEWRLFEWCLGLVGACRQGVLGSVDNSNKSIQMRIGIVVLLAVLLPLSAAVAQDASPGGEWLSFNKGLHGQRYSPLKQITTANASRLGQVCRVQIDGPSSYHAGLIVQGDTIYTATSRETVALDATTCVLRWKFDYRPEEEQCGGSSRGVALLDGRVFRGTCDGRMIALDAATGRLLWKSVLALPQLGESTTAAPLAWQGVVYMGIAGSELGVRGRVVALDAATGKELWRFHTIPMGKDVGAETWQRPETAKTGGGGVWGAMSLDVTTGELFVPVGNPWPDIDSGYRPGDNLFTNSIVVLDARTGALKWWHQVSPGDWMDLDLVAAPVLYRIDGAHDYMAIAGKDGYVTVVDRDTRKRVFRTPVTTVEQIYKQPSREGSRMCPGYAGGVEWNGPALDRLNNSLIVGAVDVCFIVKLGTTKYVPGTVNFGGSIEPDGPATGWITAMDRETGAVRWKYHAEKPVVAGITPTAGGVTFAGDLAGNFLVFNSKSGELLHKARAGGAMAGGVVTYEVAGKQYVAFAAGNISRNAFGDLGMPSVVVMTLDPATAATALDITAVPVAGKQAASVANGRRLFGQVCQSCHGPDGNMLVDHKLGNLKARRGLAETIAYIKNPKAPMPRMFPDLLDERSVVDVATWVHEELP